MPMVLTLDTPAATAGAAPLAEKPSLAGLGREGLRAALAGAGVPDKQLRMRVNQLWSWLYVRGVPDFDGQTDVAKDLRAELSQRYTLARPEIVSEQVSIDGTRKWLLRLASQGRDGKAPEIETVYIPEAERGTLCISSQVGCTLNCTFCHTGTQRLVRNLTAQEIVGQILLARDRIGDWQGAETPGDGRHARGRAALLPLLRAQDHKYRAEGQGRAALQLRQRQSSDGNRRRRRGA